MAQKYAAYNATTGAITGFYDAVDSPVPSGASAIEITDEQWQTAMTTPGYSVQNGALVAPNAAQLLASAQATQSAILRGSCSSAIMDGFSSSALGSTYTYPSATTDQRNLSDAAIAAALNSSGTSDLWCADASNNWAFVTHTAGQVQQVHAAWLTFRQAQQAKLVTLVADVNAATSVGAVQGIQFS